MKNKNIRIFTIGLLAGILIWFFIDLIWDWKGHVDDYNRGHEAAKELFSKE